MDSLEAGGFRSPNVGAGDQSHISRRAVMLLTTEPSLQPLESIFIVQFHCYLQSSGNSWVAIAIGALKENDLVLVKS